MDQSRPDRNGVKKATERRAEGTTARWLLRKDGWMDRSTGAPQVGRETGSGLVGWGSGLTRSCACTYHEAGDSTHSAADPFNNAATA